MEPAANGLDSLSQYAEIWRQSRQMMDAAREGDWDLLIELEQARARLSKALLDQARSSSNFLADQPEKAGLIRNILACDAETKLLIVPRQQELKATFGSIDTEKKLQRAYDMAW